MAGLDDFEFVTVCVLFAAVALVLPRSASAGELSLDVDWDSDPESLEGAVEGTLSGSDWRKFSRREQTVTLNDENWTQFFVFYEDELIAQGFERTEEPPKTRFGTISDIVSYDNDYWAASSLTSRFGEPDFKDVRTKSDYSQELGDPAERAKRSVDWDLKGERFRWETDDGTIRYSIRYSLKGERDHYLVRVRPGSEKHYHFYRIARAFRRAGVRVVRRFERRSRKMVVAMVTSSGETVKSEVETEGDKLVPVQPEKDQHTHRCKFDGKSCKLTVRTYGGWIYRVDVDFSSSGKIGRRQRGAFDKVGERVYKRFLKANKRLKGVLGEPAADTSVTDLDDGRKRRRVRRIPQGMEAFWTVWYHPVRDMLVRHVITGDMSGTSWQVDHRVIFRLHSVTRAFADQAAWKAESSVIEKRREMKEKMKIKEDVRKKLQEKLKQRANSPSKSDDESSEDSEE